MQTPDGQHQLIQQPAQVQASPNHITHASPQQPQNNQQVILIQQPNGQTIAVHQAPQQDSQQHQQPATIQQQISQPIQASPNNVVVTTQNDNTIAIHGTNFKNEQIQNIDQNMLANTSGAQHMYVQQADGSVAVAPVMFLRTQDGSVHPVVISTPGDENKNQVQTVQELPQVKKQKQQQPQMIFQQQKMMQQVSQQSTQHQIIQNNQIQQMNQVVQNQQAVQVSQQQVEQGLQQLQAQLTQQQQNQVPKKKPRTHKVSGDLSNIVVSLPTIDFPKNPLMMTKATMDRPPKKTKSQGLKQQQKKMNQVSNATAINIQTAEHILAKMNEAQQQSTPITVKTDSEKTSPSTTQLPLNKSPFKSEANTPVASSPMDILSKAIDHIETGKDK